MIPRATLAIIIVFVSIQRSKEEKLWCFECNTDLTRGHTRECNDPYAPSAYFDLVLCPQNESQHCLKSVIDYDDVLVTVRGCVATREIDEYCQPGEHFPAAAVTCSFCHGYACNPQTSIYSFASLTIFPFVFLAMRYSIKCADSLFNL